MPQAQDERRKVLKQNLVGDSKSCLKFHQNVSEKSVEILCIECCGKPSNVNDGNSEKSFLS